MRGPFFSSSLPTLNTAVHCEPVCYLDTESVAVDSWGRVPGDCSLKLE